MRVISGKYKGLKLKGADIKGTRTTMDRIKESVFAMINLYIKDSVCLDLFSGSGSIGIELLSNYASSVYMVDNNSKAINVIKENTEKLGNAYIIKSDYIKYLNNTTKKYDLIYLDPPYDTDYVENSIKIITERELLNEDGIIVVETNKEMTFEMNVIKSRSYKEKNIYVLKDS